MIPNIFVPCPRSHLLNPVSEISPVIFSAMTVGRQLIWSRKYITIIVSLALSFRLSFKPLRMTRSQFSDPLISMSQMTMLHWTTTLFQLRVSSKSIQSRGSTKSIVWLLLDFYYNHSGHQSMLTIPLPTVILVSTLKRRPLQAVDLVRHLLRGTLSVSTLKTDTTDDKCEPVAIR